MKNSSDMELFFEHNKNFIVIDYHETKEERGFYIE